MRSAVGFTRHRYGASFVDPGSGLRFEGHHPRERPDLWLRYLDAAEQRYREHGVERVLNRAAIENGESVSLFWIAFDGDDVVGGLRCHGPLHSPYEAQAFEELSQADPESLDVLRDSIARRINHGVVEIKGVWSVRGRGDRETLSNALARCFVHSMQWFGVRYGICTAADQAIARWSTAGAQVEDGVSRVAYPDDRYRTGFLWWDLEELRSIALPTQLAQLAWETSELWASGSTLGADDGAGDADALPRSSWAPEILDPRSPEDMIRVEALIDDPAVEVRDSLVGQLRELRELVPMPEDDVIGEAPRWVYYDWRRALVRVVGPRSFRQIRLDRNRNKITVEEQQRVGSQRIGVVGLSVGHVIAHTLALEGLCAELRLADFDAIELSNLNRIPGGMFDLGINKAVVAARRIAELDPYLQVEVFPGGVTPENVDAFLDGLDVVVEECDSLDLKVMIREACRARGIPVIMETSDRGMLDVERFDLEPDRAVFHGLLGDTEPSELMGLSTHDKVPHVLRILEPAELSSRMAASMAEIDHTVTTWPQLGGDVTLGAATVASAIRRLGRSEPLPSGRVRLDLDGVLDRLQTPAPTPLIGEVPELEFELPPPDLAGSIAHAANLAPSGGNVQPWRFETDDASLRIFLAPERSSKMDVRHRGSYVAIGAALLNAQIAAAMHGRLGPVELFPETFAPEHVATLRFGDEVDVALAELYPAVLSRSTNRREGQPTRIDDATVALLRSAATEEGALLRLVEERDAIEHCAELLAESDRIRFLSADLHREMMSELRWPGRDPLTTGIDVRTLELDDSDLAKLAVARRSDIMGHLASWNAGRALGDVTRDRVLCSSGLAMITVPRPDPECYVQGGAALQRVWLTAHQAGLAIQPVSPVFIFATDHDDFVELVPEQFVEPLERLAREFRSTAGVPSSESFVLFLRIAHAPAASARSARLPLAEARRILQRAVEPRGDGVPRVEAAAARR